MARIRCLGSRGVLDSITSGANQVARIVTQTRLLKSCASDLVVEKGPGLVYHLPGSHVVRVRHSIIDLKSTRKDGHLAGVERLFGRR